MTSKGILQVKLSATSGVTTMVRPENKAAVAIDGVTKPCGGHGHVNYSLL